MRLPRRERGAAVFAMAAIIFWRVTVHVVPFRALMQRLQRARPATVRRDPAWPGIVQRAVHRAGSRAAGATCLVQSLAGLTMLRRGGYPATWRLGVSAGDAFSAHAWVECDGTVIAGDTERLASYSELFRIDDAASAATS